MSERDVFDVDGAAEFLATSTMVVRRMLHDGELPGRKVGREWRVSRTALLAWLDHTGTTPDEPENTA